MLVKMDHPTIGELPLVVSPLKMSDTPVEYRLPPPLMGEHTAEVLRELGYENDEGRNV
jgi:crotonobetainyl-CoA:carnitine CoA-transferase CaiB-like acyl-CoA transferase